MANNKKILIHISHKPIKKINYVEQKSNSFKPRGLWYALGKTWLNFCEEQMYDCPSKIKFFYVVNPYVIISIFKKYYLIFYLGLYYHLSK